MKFNEVEDVRLFERNERKTKGSKQTNDMPQKSIDLFRKYLLTKSEIHNVGKTNKEESDVIKNKSPPLRPLIPLIMPSSKFDCNFSRPPSLLERRLLPGIIPEPELSSDEIRTSSSTSNNDKSSNAQLTIFYAGVINVYDNVPTDKAQAIMVLAGESCLSRPVANEKPKTEAKPPLHHRPNVAETSCKLQAAGLPIARKISLHHFLAKRRRRIVGNSPYAAAAAAAAGINCSDNRDEEREKALNLEHHISQENNCSISLSPFPSRLGYFSPVPPN